MSTTDSDRSTQDGDDAEQRIWSDYLNDPTPERRDVLMDRYDSQVRKMVASFIAKRYHHRLEFDELLQAARVALLESIDRYEPTRTVSFMSYARVHIRGAIIDAIERCSEMDAQQAQRRRIYRERLRALNEADPAQSSKDRLLHMIEITMRLALGYLLEDSHVSDSRDQSDTHALYHRIELDRLREQLKKSVELLPEHERLLITRHYFEHREFKAVAEELKVSKGRVSQLHAQALDRMRHILAATRNFDVEF